MGYTTEFEGRITIEPPLSVEEIAFLNKFSNTRRMNCKQGPYYVDRGGFAGQDNDPEIIDYNNPPEGQPGLWCQWVPTDDGTAIEWNGAEKFYNSEEWMQYLIDHFIGQTPRAKSVLPFLGRHTLNGEIEAEGEERGDVWKLVVKDNQVSRVSGRVVYER
jgi:hypothetical protein